MDTNSIIRIYKMMILKYYFYCIYQIFQIKIDIQKEIDEQVINF